MVPEKLKRNRALRPWMALEKNLKKNHSLRPWMGLGTLGGGFGEV